MAALIRSAQVATRRARLSQASAVGLTPQGADEQPNVSKGVPATSEQSLAAMRAQIEAQVREEWLSTAQVTLLKDRERAHQEGYAAGMAAAKPAAAKALEEAVQEFRARAANALSALEQANDAAASQWTTNVGEVAFEAVCRIVSRKAISQEFVLGVVEQTCIGLRAGSQATVRMHPRDLEILAPLVQDRDAHSAVLHLRTLALTLVPDESLGLGGCVIDSPSGQFDGSLESQLRRLHALLVPGDAPGHLDRQA